MGMILGSFIKQEAQAHIAWVFIVPMAMLSGAWFPTEGMAQVMLDIAKIFPSTYAIPAASDIISRGLGFGAIASDFYILLGFAAALFIIGALLFRRRIVI
jgi:ABC-2 type transport system permease protein